MRISIFGAGYVGAVTAGCLAESGHEVVIFDVNPAVMQVMAVGRAPLAEKGLDDLIARHRHSGRIAIAADAADAVLRSDLSMICVGTPSDEAGALSLTYVLQACEEIGSGIRKKNKWHGVVVRSTMLPGSARQRLLPTLEKFSELKAGEGFGFAVNPEFMREGSAVNDFFNPPKIVIGAFDQKTAQMVASLYDGFAAPCIAADLEIAEGVKYADNAWHAMKVGFANEIGRIMKAHGVDSHAVMDIFCLDTKLNISRAYLRPGFAFGGSCLPKDVRALRASAASRKLQTPLFDALLHANDEQIVLAAAMIAGTGKRRVGLIGLAFKAGTDDLRESPLLRLAEFLLAQNHELKIYDPHVKKIDGDNGVLSCLTACPEDIFLNSEVIVAGHFYPALTRYFDALDPAVAVIDLVRLDDAIRARPLYQGICW